MAHSIAANFGNLGWGMKWLARQVVDLPGTRIQVSSILHNSEIRIVDWGRVMDKKELERRRKMEDRRLLCRYCVVCSLVELVVLVIHKGACGGDG